MKKNLRSWMATLVLVAVVMVVAVPAFAATFEMPPRAAGGTVGSFMGQLAWGIYSEVRSWLEDWGLQSAPAASGAAMDPDG